MPGPGAFRFLLALVVVMHHSTPLRLGAWSVYVFFILSGYWIVRMWDERYRHTQQPAVTFLLSRWLRLMPVLAISLGITVLVYRIWGRSLPEFTLTWVVRQLPVLGSTFGARMLPPQWSLDVEMQFYCAAALLLPVLFKLRTSFKAYEKTICATAILSLAGTLLYLLRGGAAESPRLLPWLGFFLTGAWIWRTSWKPGRQVAWAGAGIFVVLTLASVIVPATRDGLFIIGANAPRLHPGNWPAVWQAIGALLAAPFVAENMRITSSVTDRLLSNWAYPLYLFHWIVREWYYRNVDWSLPWWHSAGLLTINVTIALAGSFAILWLVDRPLDRIRTRWVKARMIPTEEQQPVPASARV